MNYGHPIFLDTEFTDLVGIMFEPGLISIGLAADNGEEWYAELSDTWDEVMCNFFVIEAVLPHLQYTLCKDGSMPDYVISIDVLAQRLKAWIESLDEPVTFWSDAPHYDWGWITKIFHNRPWPANLNRQCMNTLSFESDREQLAYRSAEEEFWRSNKAVGAVRHHALWDARSIRFAHRCALRNRHQ